MPPDTPPPSAADLAAAWAILEASHNVVWGAHPNSLEAMRDRIAAALARRADEARREERTAFCLAAPAAELEAVEKALLRVARNVVKHCVTRDGWHEGDECFLADLRAAEAELLTMADSARREGVAEGRRECAALLRATADDYERSVPAAVLRSGAPAGETLLLFAGLFRGFADRLAALPPPGEG